MKWQYTGLFAAVIMAILTGCGGSGGGGIINAPDSSDNSNDTSGTNISITSVKIPAGNFVRGYGDQLRYPDEYPADSIYIDAFSISKTEITNSQYVKFLNDGNSAHYNAGMKIGLNSGTYTSLSGMEDHPVVFVDYDDAVAFAEWAGGRLPTEAEWEKAARGTDGRDYPWGWDWEGTKADAGRGNQTTTKEVGSYPAGASPYGVLDMAGSVWEWCSDWYVPYYYMTNEGSQDNPTGPVDPLENTIVRCIRGGSFQDNYLGCLTWKRYYYSPDGREQNLGFRVAWDL